MKKMSLITDRINEQLNYLGLSRADMCRFTGISESTVRNWIRGTSPQAEMLFKVARFLNVSLEYLITGKNPPQKSEKEEKTYDSEFLELFNSLPECEQTEIKEIVKLKCRKCAVSQTRKQHENNTKTTRKQHENNTKKKIYSIFNSIEKCWWIIC